MMPQMWIWMAALCSFLSPSGLAKVTHAAAGVAAPGGLDDDVEDPADSPFPRVSFLLTPLILVPTASGSARPYEVALDRS